MGKVDKLGLDAEVDVAIGLQMLARHSEVLVAEVQFHSLLLLELGGFIRAAGHVAEPVALGFERRLLIVRSPGLAHRFTELRQDFLIRVSIVELLHVSALSDQISPLLVGSHRLRGRLPCLVLEIRPLLAIFDPLLVLFLDLIEVVHV